METKTRTQWFNWKEWKTVVDDAYNEENDVNAYRRSFAAILAWEARDASLPASLICLKELLMGKLSKLNRASDTIDQIYSYQASLSMNLVRFVNFITEQYQNTKYAKPVKQIADEIGLPYWIVNLRHHATHYNLPSIEILERALDFLFLWLKEFYVNKYKETELAQSLLNDIKNSIESLFVDYMNSQYKLTMRNKKNVNNGLPEDLTVKLEKLTTEFKNETFEILLEDGYLIPTREQLAAFGIVPEEFLEQDGLYIPKSFLNIWTTFLTYCNENNLIGLLFQNLLNTYKLEAERNVSFNNEYLRKKFLLSWIICLLKMNSFKNEKSKNSKFYFEFSFKKVLLDILCSNTDHLGTYFMNEISKIPSFSNEINNNDLEKLKTIINFVSLAKTVELNEITQDTENNNQMELDDNIVYNMSLFERKNKTDYAVSFQTNSIKAKHIKSDWKLIDDLDWNQENLKIGMVEGQSDFNQFLQDNTELNDLNKSYSNNDLTSNASENKSISKQNVIKELNKENIEFFKRSLMVNYWELN